jgi:hypothetical protein
MGRGARRQSIALAILQRGRPTGLLTSNSPRPDPVSRIDCNVMVIGYCAVRSMFSGCSYQWSSQRERMGMIPDMRVELYD